MTEYGYADRGCRLDRCADRDAAAAAIRSTRRSTSIPPSLRGIASASFATTGSWQATCRSFRGPETTGSSTLPANRSSSSATRRVRFVPTTTCAGTAGARCCSSPRACAIAYLPVPRLDLCARTGACRPRRACRRHFRPDCYGLKPCALRVVEGLVFVSLSEVPGPDLDAVSEGLSPYLQLARHRRRARRASPDLRRCARTGSSPWRTTWSAITASRRTRSIAASRSRRTRSATVRRRPWRATRRARGMACTRDRRSGSTLPEFGTELPLDERLPVAQFGAAYRAPLHASYQSATQDGQPAAPLMGGFQRLRRGETALGLGPFTLHARLQRLRDVLPVRAAGGGAERHRRHLARPWRGPRGHRTSIAHGSPGCGR